MDAKSEAVIKSSSSTSKSIVASESSMSSSSSVVVSKKAMSSEKVVASKLVTSGVGVDVIDAIDADGGGGDSLLPVVSFPPSAGVVSDLSGRMSDLMLVEDLNAGRSTNVASVLSKQSEGGEQEATAEVTVKLAPTAAEGQDAAETETTTVTVKKVVVVAESAADQTDGNEIEEEVVEEEVVEEEGDAESSGDVGAETTTTVTVVTVKKKTSDGDVVDDVDDAAAAASSAETTTTTTTTKTTTVKKTSTIEEPKEEEEESVEKATIETKTAAPAIETTPPTPTQAEPKAAEPKAEQAEPKAEPKAEVEVEVNEENADSEDDDDEEEEEEEESEVEEQTAQTSTTTTTTTAPATSQETKTAAVDQVDSADKPTTEVNESAVNTKQAALNSQIKDIISDIDSNIKEEEHIAQLKQQELELIRKQQELAKQIEQQQLLANQLAVQNQLKQQELQQQQYRISQQQQQQYQPPPQRQQQQQLYGLQQQSQPQPSPQANSSSYETYEETQNENGGFTRKSFKSEESSSSNVSKTIDLRKIFTPATDAPEILPKNRKLYASSAFYSPTLHPTVEDQVELARRISHSLSDISNQTSKGQSMYVNRKKRSVKWVHEGSGQDEIDFDYEDDAQASKENTDNEAKPKSDQPILDKLPLKLVMNPRGQMRDYKSVSDSLNIETGLLSPDNCAELITALQLQKGRGAELFAKRRRKADNWVVDETNAGTQSPSGLPDYHQYQPKPPTSPNLLPAYSDAGKHRVQLNLHQEQMIDKYAKPALKVVKSPWEAALETGSASAAFVEDAMPRSHTPTPSASAYSPAPATQYHDSLSYGAPAAAPSYGGYQQTTPAPLQSTKLPQANQYQHSRPAPVNLQRDLAYKPSIAQGWKAPGVELSREFQHEYQQISDYQQYEETACRELELELQAGLSSDSFEGGFCPISTTTTTSCQSLKNDPINHREERVLQPVQSVTDTAEVEPQPTKKIDVQRQLQQFEEYQERLAQQEARERLILERREKSRKQRQERRKQQGGATNSSCLLRGNSPQRLMDVDVSQKSQQCVGVEEVYVQVAVRDLISSFEKQSLAEAELALKQEREPPTTVNNQMPGERQEESYMERHESEDLYVPKEIPLDSYAPPPALPPNQSAAQSFAPSWNSAPAPQQQQQQPWQPKATSSPAFPQETAPYIPASGNSYASSAATTGFPLSKPTHTGGFSSSAVPKQQLYAPTSYQKVAPTTSQGAPPVGFNPSPIPYEKLSKFENPDPSPRASGIYSPQRHLNVRGSSRVRNLSPTPFGARSPVSYGSPAAKSYSPRPASVQQQHYGGGSHYDAGYGTSAPEQSSFSSGNYLQGPTFNSTARGWGGLGGAGQQRFSQPKPVIAAAGGGLPYSDF